MSKSPEGKAPDTSVEVMFPDRHLVIGGVEVTVRELTFSEQLRHNHLLSPLADVLASIPPQQLEGPDSINVIYDVLALYADSVRELLAISTGQSVAWVDALPPGDGEVLMLSWWMVNSGFFVRRLWRPRLLDVAKGRGQSPVGGESSPTSSAPDTAASPSATTPAGN